MNQNNYQRAGASRAHTSERQIESIIGISRNFNLTASDISAFEASGISLETQKFYGLRRVTDEIGAEVVGQKRVAGRSFAGIVLPIYSEPGSGKHSEFELRRDEPDKVIKDGVKKEEGKYLRPAGKSFLAYPPNATLEECRDVSIPVIVCEGTKKMLALEERATYKLAPGEKRRFLPVAISGVHGLRGKVGSERGADGELKSVKGLLIGFQKLELKHRVVIILFDNDVHTNFKVRLAQHKTGETIQNEKQAVVYFVDLPKAAGDKIGVDDLLGRWQTEGGADSSLQNLEDLLKTKYRYSEEIKSTVAEGKLTIGVQSSDRKKCKVSAKDADGGTLAIDTFNLSEADKRNKFIKQINEALTLSEDEKTEVARELLKLADASELLTEAKDATPKNDEVIETNFQVLKDSRIIEQVYGGLAIYDPETGEHEILEAATDSDGTTYKPIDDELFTKKGGIYLAETLTEYGTEPELIADIEKYLLMYLDLKPLFLKLTALYILFTYISDSDSILELSYLNATGDAGSGKSRFGLAVCIASHRGLSLITPSAASLYRIVDKFQPTLFLDEFNSDANSDDAAAIIQILNAGFQQTAQIPRQIATADGKYKTEMFNPFCPKIIGSLKQSASNAFNSRCIEIQMERTIRNDIPLRLSRKLLNDALMLRNKLTLWRMRNIQADFDAKLDRAERELRESGIMPRSIQINIPLFALINDDNLKSEFIALLKGRDVVLNDEKQQTFDGELIKTLHTILFDVEEGADGKAAARWSDAVQSEPADGELCEHLRIEKVVLMLNHDRNPKDQFNSRYVGRKISGFGLRSDQILSRKSEYHKKSAILFDAHRLKVIFKNYGLPLPPDFCLDQLDQDGKPLPFNGLTWSKEDFSKTVQKTHLDQVKPNGSNSNGEWSNWSKENSGKGVTDKINENNCNSDREVFEV